MKTVATCPPSATPLHDHLVPSALATWSVAFDGWAAYGRRAIARQATPLDVVADMLRFNDAMTTRRPPTWSTPHEIAFTAEVARLRDFSQGSTADVVPTLLVPPQAGHDSCIVDYSEAQSQVKTIRAAGLERCFALDWMGATQATKDASIGDYLAVIARAVDHIGTPVNLIGDCQGGWLATIYAALHPEQVNTLTIAGAPIDFHAGGAGIHAYVDVLGADMAFYESIVALGNGVLKGEYMVNGFVAIRPENELAKQLQVLMNIDDETYLARFHAFEDWFKHTQDIPGAFYLWIVERLFRDNALVRGALEIDGRRADLGAIACPLYLLAGADDHITPPDQVFALAEHTRTPARKVVKRVTSGGHLGLFMGSEALREHWPPILAGVMERSQAHVEPEPTARKAKAVTPRRKRTIPAP